MAERDEPNERSLFTRIKDCVLLELRRSKGEVKKATCPSRSTWAWKPEENEKKEHSVEDSKPEDGEREESGNETREEQGTKDEVSRDRRSAEAQKNTSQRSEKDDATLAAKERGSQERHRVDGQVVEENGKSHSRDTVSENERQQTERNARSAEAGEEEDEEGKRAGGTREPREKDKETRDAPLAEAEKKAAQDSCGNEKFKPVRYYIKMQNPEAPVCCATLIKPSKVCPPKTRRPQRESRDSFTSRSNTCRCGGCSSDPGGNH